MSATTASASPLSLIFFASWSVTATGSLKVSPSTAEADVSCGVSSVTVPMKATFTSPYVFTT